MGPGAAIQFPPASRVKSGLSRSSWPTTTTPSRVTPVSSSSVVTPRPRARVNAAMRVLGGQTASAAMALQIEGGRRGRAVGEAAPAGCRRRRDPERRRETRQGTRSPPPPLNLRSHRSARDGITPAPRSKMASWTVRGSRSRKSSATCGRRARASTSTASPRTTRALQRLVPVPVMPVVKADAYGHGALPVARRLLAAGAPMLAVAYVEEAVALREGGISVPIVVLAAFGPGQERVLAEALPDARRLHAAHPRGRAQPGPRGAAAAGRPSQGGHRHEPSRLHEGRVRRGGAAADRSPGQSSSKG